MAEAFGKPLLDCDNIPEPGYAGEDKGEFIEGGEIFREPMTEEESAELDAEMEEKRIASEQQHQEFVGVSSLKPLIGKIYKAYNAK